MDHLLITYSLWSRAPRDSTAIPKEFADQLSAIDVFLLSLNHFLNLCAKDVYLSVDQMAPPRNMQPVSLLAFDDELVGVRNVNDLAYAKPGQLSTP